MCYDSEDNAERYYSTVPSPVCVCVDLWTQSAHNDSNMLHVLRDFRVGLQKDNEKKQHDKRSVRSGNRYASCVQPARYIAFLYGDNRLLCSNSNSKAVLRRYRSELCKPCDNRQNSAYAVVHVLYDDMGRAVLLP